jgi:hypothetical protein
MRSNSIQNNQAIASIYYGYVTLLFFPESTPLYFLVSFIYYLSVTCIRTYLNGLLPSVRSNPNMVKIFVGFCSSDRSRPHACAYVVVRCGNTATPTHTNPSHRPLPRLTATGRPTWPAGCGQTALQGGRSCGLQEQKQGISPRARPALRRVRACLPAAAAAHRARLLATAAHRVLAFWLAS